MYAPNAYFSKTNIGIGFDTVTTVSIPTDKSDLRRWPPTRLQGATAPKIIHINTWLPQVRL
jgi:hypothetical protein